MSNPELQDRGQRQQERQIRPPWDHPEESCGGFITKLPGPRGKSIWLAVGRAATVWQKELSCPILELVRKSKAAFGSDLSLFIYMIGRDKSTASPRIIFCSHDIKTRKAIRKVVETSGILKNHPSIGLGDSSSPLAREACLGSVFAPIRHPVASVVLRNLALDKGGDPPQELDHHAQHAQPDSKAVLVPSAAAWDRQAQQHGSCVLIRPFGEISITPRCPTSFSCDDSAYGTLTESLDSNPSRSLTPTSSMHGMCLSECHIRSTVPRANSLHHVEAECDAFDSADDPESYSESDDMEEPTILAPADLQPTISQEMSRIINRVVTAFEAYRRRGTASGDRTPRSAESAGTGAAQSSFGAYGSTGSYGVAVSLGKRPFPDQDDTGDVLNADSKRTKTSKPRDGAFACPYWKKNAQAYSHCSKFKFEEVKRVKQHLYRNHAKKIRCPRCQILFPTRDSCDGHLGAVDCERRPKVFDEGIDQDQAVRLNKRGSAALNQVQRWYVAWDIVFPGVAKPVSPFHEDDGVSLSQFQGFLRREGPAIILGHMRRNPNWNQNDEESFSQGSFGAIFDEIERQWLAQRIAGSSQTPVVSGITAELPDGEPSTDLSLDSPSPPGAGGAGAADAAHDGDEFNILDLQRDPCAFRPDNEVAAIDGEQYVLPDEDLASALLYQWTDINLELGSSS